MQLEELPEKLRDRVSAELETGERVFWIDQPRPGSGFSWLMWIPSLFAIPWTGFTLFWIAGAIGVFDKGWGAVGQLDIQRLLFGMFGIPFLLVGVGLFFSPVWTRRGHRKAARNTVYLITDRRALVLNAGYVGEGLVALIAGAAMMGTARGSFLVTSYLPEKLLNIHRVQRDDGSGDILFGEPLIVTESSQEKSFTRDGFFSIPDAREVEKMLRVLAREGKKEEEINKPQV